MATNLSKKRGREEEERRKEVEEVEDPSKKCLVDEEGQRKHVVPEEVKEEYRKSTQCQVCGNEEGEESGVWVQCDKCDRRYHAECVDMTKEEADAMPYFCINCEIDVLGVDYIKPQV